MFMILKIKNGLMCDVCLSESEYKICGFNGYAEHPTFTIFLCKKHLEQFASNISEILILNAESGEIE